jgi:linoleoyl-CoA desaturase
VSFDNSANEFQVNLRRRVDEFFARTGRRPRDCPSMYAKTAILLVAFATLYVFLVFGARAWWQAVPLSVLLGLAAAAIGLNVQHDGVHQSYSRRAWVNRLMASSLDVLGGSSYIWGRRHSVYHHTYVNIAGHDTDIDLGSLGRLAPQQRRRWFHRWQHVYMWLLYGFMTMHWQLYDDFESVAKGRVRAHRLARPVRAHLVQFIAGKSVFLALAFGVPLLMHSVGAVLAFYALTAMVIGFTLSVTFQLAHCVEEAGFAAPAPLTGRIDNAWAVHQVESTVDFARRNRALAWFLGGLNFQIEHHLFPRVCHVHYPALAPLVEQTCREYGLRYSENPSVWAGVASHYRWLRRMGTAEAAG